MDEREKRVRATFPLSAGDFDIAAPATMTALDIEALHGYLEVFLGVAKRRAEKDKTNE